MEPSQVLPVLAVPSIQMMFSGLTPLLSGCVIPCSSCRRRICRCCRFIRSRALLSSRACSLARSGSGTHPRVTPASRVNPRPIRNLKSGNSMPPLYDFRSLSKTTGSESFIMPEDRARPARPERTPRRCSLVERPRAPPRLPSWPVSRNTAVFFYIEQWQVLDVPPFEVAIFALEQPLYNRH